VNNIIGSFVKDERQQSFVNLQWRNLFLGVSLHKHRLQLQHKLRVQYCLLVRNELIRDMYKKKYY
jgi:hypothetical protein